MITLCKEKAFLEWKEGRRQSEKKERVWDCSSVEEWLLARMHKAWVLSQNTEIGELDKNEKIGALQGASASENLEP